MVTLHIKILLFCKIAVFPYNFLMPVTSSKYYVVLCYFGRAFEDEKKARLGVNECTNHDLITPYPVLYEKDGEYVAQMKYTVLLMPNGPLRYSRLNL